MIIKRCCLQLHVSYQTKLQETKQRNASSTPTLPSLSSGSLPPPFFFFSHSFHHMKREGKPSWPFLQPRHPSTSQFQPLLPFPTLLLPIRSRESLSNNTLHLHIHTHSHTHTEFLLTPTSFTHTHTFIFCALHFKHMKGCSAGTKAKGRVGGGGKEKRRRRRRRGYKSSA